MGDEWIFDSTTLKMYRFIVHLELVHDIVEGEVSNQFTLHDTINCVILDRMLQHYFEEKQSKVRSNPVYQESHKTTKKNNTHMHIL